MIIELLNGTRYDISEYGLKRLFHHIPSAEINHTTSSVEGWGEIITDTTINQRTMRVELGFRATDIYDYYLLRDELNALFLRREAFYIIFKREHFKKWKVKIAGQFEIPPTPRLGSFTLEFRTVNKYAESIGTSLQLVDRNFDSGLWGWGSHIDVDEGYQYEFTTNEFIIHNIGTEEIDPCKHFLEIEIQATAASFLQIENLTTGDVYRFNEALTTSDVLKINGVRTLKNGVSKLGSTNKRLLKLATGQNSIRITGGTIIRTAFNFNFLYK